MTFNRLVYDFTSLALEFTDTHDVDLLEAKPEFCFLRLQPRIEGEITFMFQVGILYTPQYGIRVFGPSISKEYDDILEAKIDVRQLLIDQTREFKL